MTLFTTRSGLGMLGAFVFHDMIKEFGIGVNRFVASIWKWSTGKIVVYRCVHPSSKEGCLGLKSWLESSTLFSWQLLFH